MLDQPKAQAVAEAVVAAFPDRKKSPSPDEVEALMRPFAPITQETEEAIEELLRAAGTNAIKTRIGSWLEANDVVSGTGPEVERRIQFLMMDTCTCVLDHLPAAIAHATKEVDPRVRALLGHEYLKQ